MSNFTNGCVSCESFRKPPRIAIAVFTFASVFSASATVRACSVVVTMDCKNSSQNPRIFFRLNGQSTMPDTLTLTDSAKGSTRTLKDSAINPDGSIVLPDLTPGSYVLHAQDAAGKGDDLCLQVSAAKHDPKDQFTLAFHVLPPPPPSQEELLATALTAALSNSQREQLHSFSGIVKDPTGATAAGVEIQVLPARELKSSPAIKTVSDANGSFTVPLSDGSYAASFRLPGFKTKIVAFDIRNTLSNSDFVVTLNIGSCP